MHRWLSITFAAVVGLWALGSCSSDGNGNPFSGTGGSDGTPRACDDFDTPPAGCDEACTSDSGCQTGTFCFDGACGAQCTAEEGCNADENCNSRGRCVRIFDGTGGNGTGGIDGCQFVRVTPSRTIPNVMFLLDRSGSMDGTFPGPLNRWEAAHAVINAIVSGDPDDPQDNGLQSIVRFGLTSYHSNDGFLEGDDCPLFDIEIGFGLDNGSSFAAPPTGVFPSTYPGASNEDDTPTGDSIDELVRRIGLDRPPNEGPTIIVLATDGLPDRCECPDVRKDGCLEDDDDERAEAQKEAVDAAGRAHDAGIDVFALWVGNLSSNPNNGTRRHMQDVANAGVNGTGTVWVGNDPDSLSTAFRTIIGDSISCDIQMAERFVDNDAACREGDVRLDGERLSCPAQWRVKPGEDQVIELLGDACQALKSGEVTFTAEFPCEAVVVQ